MYFETKTFEELTITELYLILQLRSEVFVVEQDCIYQDLDGKDTKGLHILCWEGTILVAYARAFKSGIYFEEAAIGRVTVRENYRKLGYGHKIMDEAILALEKFYEKGPIKISAQLYLVIFYESHGFKTIGKRYLEDGIPHIAMLKA